MWPTTDHRKLNANTGPQPGRALDQARSRPRCDRWLGRCRSVRFTGRDMACASRDRIDADRDYFPPASVVLTGWTGRKPFTGASGAGPRSKPGASADGTGIVGIPYEAGIDMTPGTRRMPVAWRASTSFRSGFDSARARAASSSIRSRCNSASISVSLLERPLSDRAAGRRRDCSASDSEMWLRISSAVLLSAASEPISTRSESRVSEGDSGVKCPCTVTFSLAASNVHAPSARWTSRISKPRRDTVSRAAADAPGRSLGSVRSTVRSASASTADMTGPTAAMPAATQPPEATATSTSVATLTRAWRHRGGRRIA